MNKKLYEYELWTEYVFGEVSDEETIVPKKYYFTDKVAEEHNRQYSLFDVPRKLVKVEGGDVIEKPDWWSGNIK